MINFQVSISNPWSTGFDNIKCWYGKTFVKHKYWECEILKTNDIVFMQFSITHRRDHAGVRFEVGLVGYNLSVNIYDNRHWNEKNGTWE